MTTLKSTEKLLQRKLRYLPSRRQTWNQERQCLTCQQSFIPLSKNHVYCQKECRPTPKIPPLTPLQQRTHQCVTCGSDYVPRSTNQRYCGMACTPAVRAQQYLPTVPMPTSTIGAMTELLVCADLIARGYDVFRAVSPACYCDLVARKGDLTLHVEARTGFKDGPLVQFITKYRPGVTCMAMLDTITKTVFYYLPGTKEPMEV